MRDNVPSLPRLGHFDLCRRSCDALRIGLIAALIPTRRAAHIEPMQALPTE